MKNSLIKFWTWLVVLCTTECHKLTAEIERLKAEHADAKRELNFALSALDAGNRMQNRHPVLAYLHQPLTWKPEVDFTPEEIEQLKTFFASPTCRKLDTAMHNIAMQDLQRAWSCPPANREFEIGAAQGRLAAWVTVKTFPETLTPKSGHPEDTATGAASLEHLSP